MQDHLLSFLIFTPLLAALIGLFIPEKAGRTFFMLSIAASVFQIAVLAYMMCLYQSGGSQQLFVERYSWITLDLGSWGILKAEYFVGVDGLSFPLVALAVPVMLIATISSKTIDKNIKGYFILLLILNAAIVGSFAALDFLLFYLFFEFMLLPMFFLIGIWGGPRREYASIKFFLYTLLGSIFILIVMIGLYSSVHDPRSPGTLVHSFSMLDMSNQQNYISNAIFDPNNPWEIGPLHARSWAFLLLLIGFGIKLPLVPFHTWLPDAHVEAPTPISVILAALLLKIGGYGLLRIAYPIFPDGAVQFSLLVGIIGLISIVYGALTALASKDLKRLIAYSSVSHMGFVLLGLASVTVEGVSGSIYQMVSHGIISALLFLIAGVLYDRTHDRMIANYSGLSSKMPKYFTIVLIAFFASLGLPGFSGFIAEIMVFLGAFRSGTVNHLLPQALAILATSGLILGAVYYLWTIQRMFFGPLSYKGATPTSQLIDLTTREYLMMVPLAVAALVFGIYPQPLLDIINSFSQSFVNSVTTTAIPCIECLNR